jgi:alkanesulfonate monooxygenase SsuD/methylene tetrahydromethanopterin reductase-like flavin-dependent oxidoreductase (luciferase family)
MANHGTAFATRFKLMRERIQAMKQIWTQSTAAFDGEFVKFEPMMQWPKPVQKPYSPRSLYCGYRSRLAAMPAKYVSQNVLAKWARRASCSWNWG